MYVCILDAAGTIVVHKDLPAEPEAFLRVMAPYRADVVVGVECILRLRSGHAFTWYWLADLCSREGIPFVLGHALYMKAIHLKTGRQGQDPSIRSLRELLSGRSASVPEHPE
jgi:hypothetical protein